MKVAYVVYPDFTALDLVGPYEVISRWPDVEVPFLASSSGAVRTDRGLTVLPTDTPETLPDPDLIVVPGSGNPLPVLKDEPLLAWLSKAAPGCQWTVSVCTGASLYAAAGLLDAWSWPANGRTRSIASPSATASSPRSSTSATRRCRAGSSAARRRFPEVIP
jgi:putative intracellular protease/amidase